MGAYSCKKATEMVEKKGVVGLTFGEKLKLKLHLSICGACKSYKKQSKIFDVFFENTSGQENKIPVVENNELKSSIISKLNEG